MKKREVIIIILVAIGAITVYLLLFEKKKEEIAPPPLPPPPPAEPPPQELEDAARHAVELAEIALTAAQEAEAIIGLDGLAIAIKEADTAYTDALNAAREVPSAEASAILTQAREAIIRANQALVDGWNNVLNIAIAEKDTILTTVSLTRSYYLTQLAHLNRADAAIVYWEIDYIGRSMKLTGMSSPEDLGKETIGDNTISSLKVRPGFAITLFSETTHGGESKTFYGNAQDLRDYFRAEVWGVERSWDNAASSIRMDDSSARLTLATLETNYTAAKSALNDAIERVLTITADIRLLGILLSKVDSIESSLIDLRQRLGL